MQHTKGKPDAWVFSVYIKEIDVVHVVTYPARISAPEYAGEWGLFKQPWCSKCSALSPFWSSRIVWQTEEAAACRQLGITFWSNRLLATCGSEPKQSSCNSSHTLPDKQDTVNIGIYMLILTGLRGKKWDHRFSLFPQDTPSYNMMACIWWGPNELPEVFPPTPLLGHQSDHRWATAGGCCGRDVHSHGVLFLIVWVDVCTLSDLLEVVL